MQRALRTDGPSFPGREGLLCMATSQKVSKKRLEENQKPYPFRQTVILYAMSTHYNSKRFRATEGREAELGFLTRTPAHNKDGFSLLKIQGTYYTKTVRSANYFLRTESVRINGDVKAILDSSPVFIPLHKNLYVKRE